MRLPKLVSLALLVLSCSRGMVITPPRATDVNTQLVREVWHSPGYLWARSKWYRAEEDLTTPARVVISTQDQACIMDNNVNEPLPQEYYTCPTGKWRRGRYSH